MGLCPLKFPVSCWKWRRLFRCNSSTLYKSLTNRVSMSEKQNYNLLNFSYIPKIRPFHTSSFAFCSGEDIPHYLKDIAKEFEQVEEDIFEDNDIDDQSSGLENDIIDFFLMRAMPYEELDGSFAAMCPTCGNSNTIHDLFIDKLSGYSVCPWCCWDGSWTELTKLIDSKEDCLTQEQLDEYFSSLKQIDKSHSKLLRSSPFIKFGLSRLIAAGVRISEDLSRIVIPLTGNLEKVVGFASVSSVHPKPKIVQRLVEGESGIFCNFRLQKLESKKINKLVVVSNIVGALHLAKMKTHAVVITSELNYTMVEWIFKDVKEVTFWLENRQIFSSVLSYLRNAEIQCSAVKLPDGPNTKLSEKAVVAALGDAMSVLSDTIVTLPYLQSKVYDRIVNKDQIHGTKWTRFKELNSLLLGHRPGELTVFTGLTGSGKTTVVSEYSLDLCMQGVPTLWGSFEISVLRLCEVMLQQFHGSPLPEDLFQFRNIASKFSEMPMYYLTYHGQQPLKDTMNSMMEATLTRGVRHIIIDNLQFMLGMSAASGDWWLEQDRTVGALRQFATTFDCHVTLIVHPRKIHMGEQLNIQAISGGARITQEADNVIILQTKESPDGSSTMGPKTLQIVKNRYGGVLGETKLRFHKESITLSGIHKKSQSQPANEPSENEETGIFPDFPMLT